MATLYTQIDSNIRKTWLLIALFSFVLVGIGWALDQYYGDSAFLIFAVIITAVQTFVSYQYSDKIAMFSFNAKPLEHDQNVELFHLVENLAITAGLPMPKIYIINSEQPNAFATGKDPRHASIAITTGLIEKLDKTELEGVLAHEMSHIGNRDILLQTVIIGLVGITNIIARMFFRGMGRRSNDNDNGGGIFAIIAIFLIILSPLIAQLIQLAISRKREFLADANGAMLTRYPEGLASALEKIANDESELKQANTATAHLFIASPFKGKGLSNLFSTHPPIRQRIAMLRMMNIDPIK
jgi:heat shock protein HtpX